MRDISLTCLANQTIEQTISAALASARRARELHNASELRKSESSQPASSTSTPRAGKRPTVAECVALYSGRAAGAK